MLVFRLRCKKSLPPSAIDVSEALEIVQLERLCRSITGTSSVAGPSVSVWHCAKFVTGTDVGLFDEPLEF